MSRSGYSDDCDDLWRWRGTVANATRSKRGQAALREMLAALDAMPVKELAPGELETPEGAVCALGCLGRARGLNLREIDHEDPEDVGKALNIARSLAAEVAFENDEAYGSHEDWAKRWTRMRDWVAGQLLPGDTP